MSKKITLQHFKQDDHNFNEHTEQGMELLDKSVQEVGIIEAVTVSDDDKVISGNARHEVISKHFDGVEPIVVETDGQTPIVIKRTDIQSGTPEFTKAAILANTTAKQNINLNTELIQEVAVEELGIAVEELGVELILLGENDPVKEFEELGAFAYVNHDNTAYRQLIINFLNEDNLKRFIELTGLPITSKTRSIYFPPQEGERIDDIYQHEQE